MLYKYIVKILRSSFQIKPNLNEDSLVRKTNQNQKKLFPEI